MRSPISRVRSLTLTSMMFMMPTPPTTSEMATMPDAATVMPTATLLNCSLACSIASMPNVSGSPGIRFRDLRRYVVISAFTSSN